MKRALVFTLCLVATAAFATGNPLHTIAIGQLRAVAEPLLGPGESTQPRFDAFYADMVEALPPQERAERALELAINRFTGAADYVTQNAASWRGAIKPSERLLALVRTAVESPLMETRMAGFESHLAAYGIEKSSRSVDNYLHAIGEDTQQFAPWSLWNLGVLGARGVEREKIFSNLVFFAHATDIDMRRQAVDALAKLGGMEVVPALLDIAAQDASDAVRERAFCGLAESGTLLLAERYTALPGLLAIAQDPNAGRQQHLWTYQALREITNLRGVADDPESWRERLQSLAND